jgi:hypothetical protein
MRLLGEMQVASVNFPMRHCPPNARNRRNKIEIIGNTGGGMRVFRKGMGTVIFAASLMVMSPGFAFAGLPFITDDAGTLGKGTSQVELVYVGSTDKEADGGSTVETDRSLPGATFSYGAAETFDLTLGFARSWGTETVDGFSSNDPGNADYLLNAKWQFYENAGFRFAVKPMVGYSNHVGGTSDDHVSLYGGWLIATKEHDALSVSLNGGYFHNDYGSAAERDASRSNIWSLSALATYKVLEGLTLGVDVGASTNPDKASSELPAYGLAGAIYSLNKNVDLSLGLKFGITKPEPDFAGIAGVTAKF